MQVIPGVAAADIWCGEFKPIDSSLDTAIAQLQRRLYLLEWAVQAAWWPERTSSAAVAKTGKLYMGRRELRELYEDYQQPPESIDGETRLMYIGL